MNRKKFESYLKHLIPEKDKYGNATNHLNDSVNLYGDTILHFAVFHEQEELVTFLLENGADPKIKNKVINKNKYSNYTNSVEPLFRRWHFWPCFRM